MRHAVVCATAVLASTGLAACGGGSHAAPTTRAEPPTYSAVSPAAGIPARRHASPPDDERVIRRWAAHLRAGEIARAARLFALPAVTQIAPGSPIVELRTRAQARSFNAALPCGAELLLTEPMRGQGAPGLMVGAFRLTERRGATCDGPGATARVGFFVDDGRITSWVRLSDTPSG